MTIFSDDWIAMNPIGAAPKGERMDVTVTLGTGHIQIEGRELQIEVTEPVSMVRQVGADLQFLYNISSPTAAPPRLAEFLLYCFLSKEGRAALIGDLMQEYQMEVLPKFGPRGAKVWYWSQVIRSIAPLLFNFLSKLRKLGH